MLTAKEIRKSFTDFFASKGHVIVPSAPMVVKNDPTLMFTNAGMNQFKDIFLGNTPRKYPRVADSQKCLRVSGKHNDLEEVGLDTYHHTMFEMLGNWSFGDYFKEEAISWAWEYLVDVLKIDPDRLYATVFEGSEEDGLARDDEAATYWAKFLPKERIINGSKKDNFWEMGDTGPCGPCSEIHIDLREDDERAKVPGIELVNKDHPQVIEIWNNVFMQFNRKADGSLEALPAKHVDTGMGFERLCMAIQGKKSNYDTDVFQPIIKEIGRICACSYGDSDEKDVAMRVIADHIRTIAFSITDGQLPSNAKAGYVIRRILRRAVRYGYTFLNQKGAFMYKLIPALIDTMGDAYPELSAQQSLVEKVIKEEEESFLRTLETGIRLLDKIMADTKAAGKSEISGNDGFTLYDTFGFPLDLTELILRENKLTLNLAEFDTAMAAQKERARNAAAVETGDWVVIKEGEPQFIGYDLLESDVEILRYRKVKQKNQELYQVVFDKSPFYAEMGGQMGDSGYIESNGVRYEIIDTKKENNLSIHILKSMPQDVSSIFYAVVDKDKRQQTACNHTATHILDYALRSVLGTHVEQKGSMVSSTVLRFDFSHFQKVTDEELRQVERLANSMVRQNIPLTEYRDIPIEQARTMGAMALFGEKYGDTVRVIQYGPSMELCGGTHVQATGEIGTIRIISESSVAAGIRRIEAVSAAQAEELLYVKEDLLRDMKNFFNNTPNLLASVKKTIEENADLKKQVESYYQEKILNLRDHLLAQAKVVNGVKLVVIKGEFSADMVKSVAFQIKNVSSEPLAVLGATYSQDKKPSLTVLLSEELVEKGMNATQIVRDAAKEIQGGGGGQPFFAQAGGKKFDGLNSALDKLMALFV
ncbi:MAG: alanine--tRNA ligase [Paludibacteraceae bacterium]|nr:alanine--tRNA ligase [Paludibacteraceae bacterium]MBQ9101136.1 alanine--tRNA ligase [Paludibacteraceae bacterium]